MRMIYIGLIRMPIAALLVSALLGSQVAAGAAEHPAAPAGSKVDLSKIRIENFGKIDPSTTRAAARGHYYADLVSIGVKTIINLTSDDADATEAGMAESAGLKYVQIPMNTRVVPTVAEIAASA